MNRQFLAKCSVLSLKNTLECGQCFRWRLAGGGSYFGIASGIPAKVYDDDNKVYIETKGNISFWRNYFDLDRDYQQILHDFPLHKFTNAALEYGRGLRILRQDPWETLCSFLLSPQNSITRISSIVEKICESGNEVIQFEGNKCYAFPSPRIVACLDEQTLGELKAGFRSQWIQSAARSVLKRPSIFDELRKMSTSEARKELLKRSSQGKIFKGVGIKVADCFLLFGLGKMDAFPIDRWMERVAEHYENNLDGGIFGEYAGIAQEYVFHYMRYLSQRKK